MHRTVRTTTATSDNNSSLMHSVISATASQHLSRYNGQFARVESVLEGRPFVDEYVTLIATKTGLRKAYVIIGGALLAFMFLIFGPIAKLFGSLIGVTYPAYKSIKAIESPSNEDDRQWLTYWVVFAFFSVARNFSGFILSWFPFYNVVELGVLIWMMAPIRRNGSHFLYRSVLRPFLLKHIDTIDSTIQSTVDSVKTTLGVPNGAEATNAVEAPVAPIIPNATPLVAVSTSDNARVESAEVSPKSDLVQVDETLNKSLEKLEPVEPENKSAADSVETATTTTTEQTMTVEATEQKQE